MTHGNKTEIKQDNRIGEKGGDAHSARNQRENLTCNEDTHSLSKTKNVIISTFEHSAVKTTRDVGVGGEGGGGGGEEVTSSLLAPTLHPKCGLKVVKMQKDCSTRIQLLNSVSLASHEEIYQSNRCESTQLSGHGEHIKH